MTLSPGGNPAADADDWLARAAFDDRGRALGHDLYTMTRWLPDADWPDPVQEGFRHAASRGLARQDGGHPVRKWLQLRLNAWRRRRVVDADVTPAFLARIDVPDCPVLRVRLTRRERRDTDASVDRLNNDGAYAVGNLAVMSVAANRAKGARSFDEVLALAHAQAPTAGLDPAQWLRLAALMLGPCFADRPQDAPDIPMPVPLPNGTARLVTQQVQFLFATLADRPPGKNRLVRDFRRLCPDDASERRLRVLADVVHEGLKGLDHPWDVWLREEAMAALHAWRASLPPERWFQLGDTCISLLGGARLGTRALDAWHLPTGGHDASAIDQARRQGP